MNLSRGEAYVLPQCGHNVHVDCLRQHLIAQNDRNIRLSCPYCRGNISGQWARLNLGIDVPDSPSGDFVPSDDDEEELRPDSDGREYTRQQFISYYGRDRGRREWARAGRLMADGRRDPPRRQGTGGGKRSKSKRSKSKTKKKSKRSKSKGNKTKRKLKRGKSKRKV